MIKKSRTVPIIIPMLEALLRRLHPRHRARSKIEEELIIRKAGYRGELSLDYYLAQLPENRHYILHDIRIPLSHNAFFQMDSLLLSISHFIIYEAKHHSGTLTFEEQQMLQTYEDRTESYPDPIAQAENQQYHLENFIKKHLNTTLPGSSFVVVTNPSSIIKFDPYYEKIASHKVIRPSAIRGKSELCWKNHPDPQISNKDLQKLCNLLLKLDTPLKPNILQDFRIKHSDICPGVHCNQCNFLTMKRVFGTWKCKRCGTTDKMAHVRALFDYCLLIGNTISNRQFRNFLQLDSRSVAAKLLDSLGLPHEGAYKSRKYYLSLKSLQKWL